MNTSQRKTSDVLLATSSALALLFLCPTQVSAQISPQVEDDPAQVDDILVVAQKRSENIQDVPIAISAFSAETLAQTNVTGLQDLVRITPSLTFTYQGPTASAFLRGVGSASSYPGSEGEVLLYVDGVYFAAQAQGFMKLNNVAGVEIDKGPQGTLFGRNATGGVIQITTRTPQQTPSLEASIGYGSYYLREGNLYATTGITGNLAADLAVHVEQQDGWGSNTTLNSDSFRNDSFAIRSKWVWDISDTSTATFILDYGRDESDRGASFPTAEGAYRPTATAPIQSFNGYYNVASNRDSFNELKQGGASLKLETDIGDLSFVSISSYRKTEGNSKIDGDKTPTDFIFSPYTMEEVSASQEFQLLSPEDAAIQWIAGLYYYYNDASNNPFEIQGTRFGSIFGVTSILNYSSMETHSYSGFGQATVDLTPRTHLTGGLRYTHDYRSQTASTVFVYPTGPAAPPAFLGLGINAFPKADFGAWTGKVTLSQEISENGMVYATYSRGFKSGVFNTTIVLSNPGPALEPETIVDYEAGFKFDLFDRRLRLNGAAFIYDFENLQLTRYTPLAIALQNVESATIKGVELEFDATLSSSTSLRGGFNVLDAYYGQFPNAPFYTMLPITTANPSGGFGGTTIGAGDASGNRMAFAPKFSSYLSITHTLPILGGVDFNLTANYKTREYFTPDSRYFEDAYALFSGSAKWTSPDGMWDVTVWGRNMSDEAVWIQKTIATYGVGGIPVEPRTFGIRLGVKL